MADSKIMIVRRAEKPSNAGLIAGVSQDGSPDSKELILRDWQRSGALVRPFAPTAGSFSHAVLVTRDVIFASGVPKHSDSLHPQHTVLALAGFLAQQIDLSDAKGEENALSSRCDGKTRQRSHFVGTRGDSNDCRPDCE